MDKNIKKLAVYGGISLGSALIGGVGGWFLHDFWQKRAEKLLKSSSLHEIEESAVIDESLDEKKNPPSDTRKYFDLRRDYVDRSDENEASEDEKQDDLSKDFEEIPYQITSEQFSYDAGYDKETLIYYAGDDTFARTNDDIIDDPDSLLGPLSSDFMAALEDDYGDAIYIRNDRLGCDYEVARRKGSYKMIVLGEEEDNENPF